jgi:hypothetical protein
MPIYPILSQRKTAGTDRIENNTPAIRVGSATDNIVFSEA